MKTFEVEVLKAVLAEHAPALTPEQVEGEVANITTYFRMAQAQDPALTQPPSTQRALNILFALNQRLKAVAELGWPNTYDDDDDAYRALSRYLDMGELGRAIETFNEKVVGAYEQLEQTPEALSRKGRPPDDTTGKLMGYLGQRYEVLTGRTPSWAIRRAPAGGFPDFVERIFATLKVNASVEDQLKKYLRRK